MGIRVKANLFFQQGKSGWSEVYWLDGMADLDTARAEMLVNFIPLRQKMMGDDAKIIGLRVSDEDVIGDSLVRAESQIPVAAQTGFTCDPAFSGLLARFEAGPLYRGSKAFRGLPKELLAEPFGKTTFYQTWYPFFRDFANLLKGTADIYCLRVTNKDPIATRKQNVVGISADLLNPGFLKIRVPNHGYLGTNKVKISGCKFTNKLDKVTGTFPIFFVTADTFSIQHIPLLGGYKGFGVCRKKDTILFPISNVIPERISSHKAGRVFTEQHGRRKVQA